MNISYLHLGSNLGNRSENLQKALAEIATRIGKIAIASGVFETEAWGFRDQASFLNQAIEVHTDLEANEILQQIHIIEKSLGRKKEVKWGPRIIDIDILSFNQLQTSCESLIIPHPHLHERRFVLEPLNQIAPDWIHPKFDKTIHELLAELEDESIVNLASVE